MKSTFFEEVGYDAKALPEEDLQELDKLKM